MSHVRTMSLTSFGAQRKPPLTALSGAVLPLLLALVAAAGISGYLALASADRTREALAEKERAEEDLEAANRQLAKQHRADEILADVTRRCNRAEANFQQARQAVDSYYTQVSESQLLKASGLQPLRRELLQPALAYYQAFVEQHGDDPTVRVDLALAYDRVGAITSEIGSKEQSQDAYRRAVEIYQKLARDNPHVNQYQDGLATTHNHLGRMECASGSWADAERSYRSAIEIREQLDHDNPTASEFRASLGTAYHDLGLLQGATRRQADAEGSYQRAIEILERLASDNPSVGRYQDDLAASYDDLGRLLQGDSRRHDDAERAYQRGVEISEELARDKTCVSPYREADLARRYVNLGYVHCITGRWAEAEGLYQQAIDLYVKLVHENRTLGAYQSNLAGALVQQGDVMALLGKWRASADVYAQAVEASDHFWDVMFRWALLQLADRDQVGYRATCADLLKRYGHTESADMAYWIALACVAGENAVDDPEKVVALARRAAAGDPRNPSPKAVLGAALYRAGRTEEAIATLTRALPQHALASLVAPKKSSQIRLSRLQGEVFLALAYRDQNDASKLQKQLSKIPELMAELEETPPPYNLGISPWAFRFGVDLAKRSLALLPAAAAGDDTRPRE
jgi:tetratricopeptide (TPR) repeat protein